MSDPARIDVRPAEGYAGDITPEQAWELLAADPSAVLVDVRTQGEWRTIGIPDTVTLEKQPVFSEWVQAGGVPNPRFLEELRAAGVTDGPIVFLCRSGQRSIAAARLATASGIAPSYNVLDGFEGAPGADGVRDQRGWKVVGLPWTAGPA
ncbi:rhodanese-like domain-containing protein [Promicromonospora sp. NPDC057488]|uniref:rhodanese-like domain-containing protein n=1 Tax=Promicromonospora sp. NPDC057488 TaxID=3346147 RepID=UPI003672B564